MVQNRAGLSAGFAYSDRVAYRKKSNHRGAPPRRSARSPSNSRRILSSRVLAFSGRMASRRLFLPGLSHHVRHRGNNGSHVFRDDEDRHRYLELLAESARKYEVDVYSYCLMTTHTHAVVEAHQPDALPRMMQSLGRGYVRYFNRRHHRTGTLWEGRYRAGLIGTDYHWWNCLRYVEMNPVAARMVSCPDAYRWSSYRAHARGEANPLLASHPLFQQLAPDAASRAAKWASLCNEPLSEHDLAEIRRATRRGLRLGEGDVDSDD